MCRGTKVFMENQSLKKILITVVNVVIMAAILIFVVL